MPQTETPTRHPTSRRELKQHRREGKAQRRRKIQALAAGGLVLGVGASATMAAWTDEESSIGSFTAGAFAIEANIDGQWSATNKMTFAAADLFPDQSVYAPVSLRSSPDTTVEGVVSVQEKATSGGLVPDLSYRAVALSPGTDPKTCSDKHFNNATDQYVFGSNKEYVNMGSAPAAKATQSLEAGQANTISYCFEVRLDKDASNASQKQTATTTWEFYAESIVPNEDV